MMLCFTPKHLIISSPHHPHHPHHLTALPTSLSSPPHCPHHHQYLTAFTTSPPSPPHCPHHLTALTALTTLTTSSSHLAIGTMGPQYLNSDKHFFLNPTNSHTELPRPSAPVLPVKPSAATSLKASVPDKPQRKPAAIFQPLPLHLRR